MKKASTFVLIAALILAAVCFCGCASNYLPKPETNLEFWIAENVAEVDFSEYEEKWGFFGGSAYYGKGYIPSFDEYGNQIDPEKCVIYSVTAYPDVMSGTKYITEIYITDPEIELYGISLNSSFEAFEEHICEHGFKIVESGENFREAKNGKFTVYFF